MGFFSKLAESAKRIFRSTIETVKTVIPTLTQAIPIVGPTISTILGAREQEQLPQIRQVITQISDPISSAPQAPPPILPSTIAPAPASPVAPAIVGAGAGFLIGGFVGGLIGGGIGFLLGGGAQPAPGQPIAPGIPGAPIPAPGPVPALGPAPAIAPAIAPGVGFAPAILDPREFVPTLPRLEGNLFVRAKQVIISTGISFQERGLQIFVERRDFDRARLALSPLF